MFIKECIHDKYWCEKSVPSILSRDALLKGTSVEIVLKECYNDDFMA